MNPLLQKLKKASRWDRDKIADQVGPTQVSAAIWQGFRDGVWGEFRKNSGKMREEHSLLVEHAAGGAGDDVVKLLGVLSQDTDGLESMYDHFELLRKLTAAQREELVARIGDLDPSSATALAVLLMGEGDASHMNDAAYDELVRTLLSFRDLSNSWTKEHDLSHADDEQLARALERALPELSRPLNIELYLRAQAHLSDEVKVGALLRCEGRGFVMDAICAIAGAEALVADHFDGPRKQEAAFALALLKTERGEEISDDIVQSFKFFVSHPSSLEHEKRVFEALGERAGPVLARSVGGVFALMPFVQGDELLRAALAQCASRPERYAVPIGKMGLRALPVLREAVAGPKPDKGVAICTATALGAIESQESAEILLGLLGHSSKPVRAAAQSSLAMLGALAKEQIETGLKAKKKAVREACEELSKRFQADDDESPYGKLLASITDADRKAVLVAQPKDNNVQAQRDFVLGLLKTHKAAAFVILQEYIVSGTKSPSYKDASTNAYDAFTTLLHAMGEYSEEDRLAMADPVFEIVAQLPKKRIWEMQRVNKGLSHFQAFAAPAAARAIERHGRFPFAERLYRILALDVVGTMEVMTLGLGEGSKGVREVCVKALGRTPECVDLVIAALKSKKKAARESAAKVLGALANPIAADPLKAAAGKEKSEDVRVAIEDALRACGSKGEAEETAVSDEGEESGPRDWEAELTARKGRLPKWIDLAHLGELKLKDGTALSEGAVASLISRLKKEHERQDALAWALRKELETESAASFGAALLATWKRRGAKAADKWVLFAQAVFADEEWIHTSGANLGGMASMGRHAAATWHIDVYRRHGSQAGRDWIAFWADNASTHTLRKHAVTMLKELIAEAGVSEKAFRATVNGFVLDERHEDAVDHLGFNDRREQSLGTYTAQIAANGELRVRDADGHGHKSVPTGAPESERAQFKALKAKLAAVKKTSLRRFVRGMVGDRAWNAERFRRVFVEHPVLGSFGPGIVFARADGSLVRLSGEGTLLDVGGDDVPFEDGATYRIVHPIGMDEETKRAWGTHLGDFEIIQPFPQIDRQVYENTGKIEFDKDLKMKPNAFIAKIRDAGWRAGAPEDAGNIFSDWMRMPSHGIHLNLDHTGYHASDSSWVKNVRVTGLSFYSTLNGHVPAKNVDPIVFSEAQHLMNALFDPQETPSAKAVEEKVDAQGTKTRALVQMSRGFPSADLAKSSRAKCMFCDGKIMKDDVRIIIERMIETPRFTGKGPGYMHPQCAPKWVDEAALDLDDFVEQVQSNTAIAAQLPDPFDA